LSKSKLLKKIGKSSLIIILLFLVAFNFDPFLQVVAGVTRAVVTKQSMEPTLKEGDLVILKSTPSIEIKENDIIVFDRYITGTPSNPGYEINLQTPWIHRVYDIIEYNGTLFFKTKGDNNISIDPGLVPSNGIVGKLIFYIPMIGILYLNPIFRTINLLIIVCLVAAYIFLELKGEKKEINQTPNST